MPTDSNDLVIKDFKIGIGPSPHQGFGDLRMLDTQTRPGIARIQNSTEKKSGTTVTELPTFSVVNPNNTNQLFVIDSAGTLYQSTDKGNTWAILAGHTSGAGATGLAIWNDWLFYIGQTQVDVYGPLSGASAWTNNFKAVGTTARYHPTLVSINDSKLYVGSSEHVSSFEELTTFDPATPGSFTFTPIALDLLDEFDVTALAELGNNLMIGTTYQQNNTDNGLQPDGVLFSWDRVSPSFGTPMVMNEKGISQMITIDNVLFIQAGLDGSYYKSNGVQYVKIGQLPNYLVNTDAGRYLENRPDAMVQYKERLFFGIGPGATGTDIGGMGVWSIDTINNALVYEHAISTGNMGDTSAVTIGTLLPLAEKRILIGWKDGATSGIDITGTARYQNYQAYFDSPYYQVGTPLIKKEFSQLEFQLVQPLSTGQGVQISYRTDLSAAYTLIGTYDFATLGAVSSHNVVANIPACEFFQVRVALTTPASTNASPQLRTVTLR